jgi:hypothetical protein
MTTRDLSNKRRAVWLGPVSALGDLAAPKDTELNGAGFLNVAPAIRWAGLTLANQASTKVDDRSLADDGAATLRGFAQFGGNVPMFYPKVTDTTSILRKAYNLVKTRGTLLAWVERIGFKNYDEPAAAGDEVNTYLVMTDAMKPDTASTGGYAYVENFLAQGVSNPWTIVAGVAPAAITTTIVVGATLSLADKKVGLVSAQLLGNDITRRATWVSDNPAVAIVHQGVVVPISAGTANIHASFPGATDSTPAAVTVTV